MILKQAAPKLLMKVNIFCLLWAKKSKTKLKDFKLLLILRKISRLLNYHVLTGHNKIVDNI